MIPQRSTWVHFWRPNPTRLNPRPSWAAGKLLRIMAKKAGLKMTGLDLIKHTDAGIALKVFNYNLCCYSIFENHKEWIKALIIILSSLNFCFTMLIWCNSAQPNPRTYRDWTQQMGQPNPCTPVASVVKCSFQTAKIYRRKFANINTLPPCSSACCLLIMHPYSHETVRDKPIVTIGH